MGLALSPSTAAGLLADTEARLNKSATTADAGEIQTMLDAAVSLYERLFGPIASSVTEVRDGGGPIIMLDRTPVDSIISVTEYVGLTAYNLTSQPPGSTVSLYGYSLDDPTAGRLVRRSSSGVPMPFLGGRGSIVIVYTTGGLTAEARETIIADVAGYFEATQRGGGSLQPQFPGEGEYESAYSATPQVLFPRIRALATTYPAIA